MALAAVYAVTTVLFFIILISLGFQPRSFARVVGGIILITGIAGILLYGYGFYAIYGMTPVAVMRALFAVFCMFLGRNEISAVSAAPLLSTQPMQIALYLTHLLALYATASTVVAGIGTRLIRRINLVLIAHKDLSLLYGANEDTIAFSEKLKKETGGVTVFVDDGSGEAYADRILRMGSILFSDASAKEPDTSFLKKIGFRPGTRRLSVFCLSPDQEADLRYAGNLLSALEEAGISPEQTRITLFAENETAGEALQYVPESRGAERARYGYGSVLAIEKEDLAARLLVRKFPPYETMRFCKDAEALEDFTCVIIGFGHTGQTVLRRLLMNGQFYGSNFHAVIASHSYRASAGSFFYRYPGIRENYQITVLEENARSLAFYEYIATLTHTINYVAVCTGNEKENSEIAREITDFLTEHGCHAPVIMCSDKGIARARSRGGLPETVPLYDPSVLTSRKIDETAMEINHRYANAADRTKEEDWADCDYFSRMSCRASADFIPAMAGMSGLTEEEIAENGWPDDPVLLDHLGRTEHLRWCAFHYCFGYRPMTPEVFAERGEKYRKEMEQNGESSVRIGKDTAEKLHACLVSWEELPQLSEREAAYTGVRKDYRQMDLDNVLLIPELLRENG